MSAPDFDAWKRRELDIEHYDYLRVTPMKRFWSFLFQCLVAAVMSGYNYLFLGLHIKGRKNLRAVKGGAVVTCNHVHWLDCTMLLEAVWPRRQYFITLQSNVEMRVIGGILKVGRGMPVPVERKHLPRFAKAMDEVLKAGGTLNIYPEGELEPYCEELRHFKNGAFSQARDAGVPVVPMCFVYRKGKGIWHFKRRPALTLHILPAIYPDPTAPRGAEVIRLRDVCRAAMEECRAAEARK